MYIYISKHEILLWFNLVTFILLHGIYAYMLWLITVSHIEGMRGDARLNTALFNKPS